ncbi:MAG: hypothetical protein AB7O92_08285 [Acidimicrobiia bacterium]
MKAAFVHAVTGVDGGQLLKERLTHLHLVELIAECTTPTIDAVRNHANP